MRKRMKAFVTDRDQLASRILGPLHRIRDWTESLNAPEMPLALR